MAAGRPGQPQEQLTYAYGSKREMSAKERAYQLEMQLQNRERKRLAALREKRKEMPDPCATWDQNGGDLGNGNWPAARINAADKQYTLEAVQAP